MTVLPIANDPPMRTMADVVDMLDAHEPASPTRMDVYDQLAPLYDFVQERKFDYEASAAFVVEQAPADATTIGVGACGTGLMLPHVDAQFDTIVGFDASQAMLERAKRRSSASLVRADLRRPIASEVFDVVTILGNSITLVTPDRAEPDPLRRVLANVYESLRPGGVFVCDFMRAAAFSDGEVLEHVAESERFRVTETAITTVTDADAAGLGPVGTFTLAFDVLDRRRSKRVRTSAALAVRGLYPGSVLQEALDVGFTEAALVEPTHTQRLIARRPD